MENTVNTKQFKRTSRFPSQETKQKISQAMRGRVQSDATRQKISQQLKKYWNTASNFPSDAQRHEGTGNGWIETGDIV